MRSKVLPILAAITVLTALVVGFVQASGNDGGTPAESGAPKGPVSVFDAGEAKAKLAGAPKPLAEIHAQGSQLLEGGRPAFEARLERLKGRPIVVNKWASWCGPCRAEFPLFQQLAVERGKEVAFLGLNAGDSEAHAKAFLKRFPVPFPSYRDPRENIAQSVRAAKAYPMTVFVDRSGEVAYVHAGYYKTKQALERDIERYAK